MLCCPPYGWPTCPSSVQWGMVWFFPQAVMALAVPYVLAVLPVQAYR